METQKSYGDQGIKAVGIMSLFAFVFMNYNSLLLTKYFMVAAGAGYSYFAYRKLINDRSKNFNTNKAWTFLIIGALLFIFGVVLFVVQYLNNDIYL